MRKYLLIIMAVAGLAAGCGETQKQQPEIKLAGDVICVAGGQPITLRDIQSQARMTGAAVPDDVKNQQLVQPLIDLELRRASAIELAEQNDLNVSKQDIAERIESMKSLAGGEKAWQQQINKQGMTTADVARIAEGAVRADKLLAAYVESVTDSEARKVYRARVKQGDFTVAGGQDVFYVFDSSRARAQVVADRLRGKSLEEAQSILNQLAAKNADAGQMRLSAGVPSAGVSDAALGQRPGSVIGPVPISVSSQKGYYVIYIISPVVKKQSIPFASARDGIIRDLAASQLASDIKQWTQGDRVRCRA